MVRIRLQPLAIELSSRAEGRLLDLVDEVMDPAAIAGVPLSCRGARCGACRVRVLAGVGSLLAAQGEECETLRLLGAGADERLACQIWLRGDASEDVVLALAAPRDSAR